MAAHEARPDPDHKNGDERERSECRMSRCQRDHLWEISRRGEHRIACSPRRVYVRSTAVSPLRSYLTANTNTEPPAGKNSTSGQRAGYRPKTSEPSPLGTAMYCLPLTA